MANILFKSASFVFFIVLGYLLKRVGLFSKTDYKVLPKIILNITLPCAVITSFATNPADGFLLVAVLVGLVCNWLALGLSFLCSRKKAYSSRAVWLNCTSGLNIGTFVLPFVQSFLSPVGVFAACMMDIGNAIMCNGGTYALVSGLIGSKRELSLKPILKKLFTSVPFVVYLSMLIVTLLGLRIPQPVADFLQPAAAANPFLAMLMVGLMLDFDLDIAKVRDVAGMLALRFGVAVLCALVAFFLLPLPLAARQALCLTAFAPISVTCTAFCEKMNGDRTALACANSLSIFISVPCILALLMLFGAL